jgi:hypothetical protein
VGACLVQLLEATGIGIPAGKNRKADAFAERFQFVQRQRPFIRRDDQEMRTFGPCFTRGFGVAA